MRRLGLAALLAFLLTGCVNPDCESNRWVVSLEGRATADGAVPLCLQGWAAGGSTQARINVGNPDVVMAVNRMSDDPPDDTACWITGQCGAITITFAQEPTATGPVAATCALDLTCVPGVSSTADWSCAVDLAITELEDPPTTWPTYGDPPALDRRWLATFTATVSAPDTQATITTEGSFEMIDQTYYDADPATCDRGGGGGGWDD
jgi:hypothetical protein